MTTAGINGITVDTPVPMQNLRSAAPVISPAGVNDAAAIARQQLPSAVPAPAVLAAYSANIAQPAKPAPRGNLPQPSSQLAAQLIAQGEGEVSAEDLALFAPRATPAEQAPAESPADDYLATMRLARGETAPSETAPTQAAAPAAKPIVVAEQEPLPASQVAAQAQTESNALQHSGIGQATIAYPNAISKFLRRQNVAQAHGVEAYQFAAARNAMTPQITAEAL